MKRGQKSRAEQVVLMLRQIEVQTAQCKIITGRAYGRSTVRLAGLNAL